MIKKPQSRLSKKKRYLQVALNSTLGDAQSIIAQLPVSDRILLEAGTPLIKRYGVSGIRQIRDWYAERIAFASLASPMAGRIKTKTHAGISTGDIPGFFGVLNEVWDYAQQAQKAQAQSAIPFSAKNIVGNNSPYIVADLKTIDRGATEVALAAEGGASAAIAMGSAPIETLDTFISSCRQNGLDAMIDMMNVEYPLSVLRSLKQRPTVVILHRGVDEERDNKAKMLPLHEIRRIKGAYDVMISVAGGDTPREVQSAIFNDADIVVIWKSVYQSTGETIGLVENFLKEIK